LTEAPENQAGPALKAQARYKRVIIAFHDLSECRSYLNRLLGLNGEQAVPRSDNVLRQALIAAAVASYVRPFSGNRPAPDVEARLPVDFEERLSQSQLDLHRRVIRVRNREFAHSDPDVSEVKASIQAGPLAMPVSNIPRRSLTVEDLRTLDSVCSELHRYLHDQIMTLQTGFQPGDSF